MGLFFVVSVNFIFAQSVTMKRLLTFDEVHEPITTNLECYNIKNVTSLNNTKIKNQNINSLFNFMK
jgi:hypothetical protein